MASCFGLYHLPRKTRSIALQTVVIEAAHKAKAEHKFRPPDGDGPMCNDPSEEEIKDATALIRVNWTDTEYLIRSGLTMDEINRRKRWSPSVILVIEIESVAGHQLDLSD